MQHVTHDESAHREQREGYQHASNPPDDDQQRFQKEIHAKPPGFRKTLAPFLRAG
jgi:hypothetical protein